MMRNPLRSFLFSLAPVVLGCTALTGCLWPGLQATPGATGEKQPTESREKEPPLVVQARDTGAAARDSDRGAAPREAEAVDPRVREFIDRVDDVGQRAKRRGGTAPSANALYPSGASFPDEEPEFSAGRRPPPRSTSAPPKPAPTALKTPDAVSEARPEPAGAPESEAPVVSPPAARGTERPAPPQPPILTGVAVRAAPPREPVVPRAAAAPPAVNAPIAASQAPASLQEILEQWRGSEDTSFRRQLDARILLIAAGDHERAREPLTMVTQEQQEIAARFVEALIAIREGHPGDEAGAANAALRQLDQLAESLRPLSGLSLPTLAICREVRGYGQYQPIDPPQFPAGAASEFVLYCEVRDFVSRKTDDGWHQTRFDLHTRLLNRSGDTVLEIKDTDIVDRCRNQRKDCFIPRLVRLPATLAPGDYVLKVSLADKLGGNVAEKHAPLRVVARP